VFNVTITSEGDVEDTLMLLRKALERSSPDHVMTSEVNITINTPTMFWAEHFASELNELVEELDEGSNDPNNVIGVNVLINCYGGKP